MKKIIQGASGNKEKYDMKKNKDIQLKKKKRYKKLTNTTH